MKNRPRLVRAKRTRRQVLLASTLSEKKMPFRHICVGGRDVLSGTLRDTSVNQTEYDSLVVNRKVSREK